MGKETFLSLTCRGAALTQLVTILVTFRSWICDRSFPVVPAFSLHSGKHSYFLLDQQPQNGLHLSTPWTEFGLQWVFRSNDIASYLGSDEISFPPPTPYWFDLSLITVSIFLLLVLGVSPHSGKFYRICGVVYVIILALQILQDQVRLQPYIYECGVFILFGVMADFKNNKSSQYFLGLCRLFISAQYVHAGIGKLGKYCGLLLFQRFLELPFLYFMSIITNDPSWNAVILPSYMQDMLCKVVAFIEIGAGILYFIPIRRAKYVNRIASLAIAFTHVIILITLIPGNINQAVWPWNVYSLIAPFFIEWKTFDSNGYSDGGERKTSNAEVKIVQSDLSGKRPVYRKKTKKIRTSENVSPPKQTRQTYYQNWHDYLDKNKTTFGLRLLFILCCGLFLIKPAFVYIGLSDNALSYNLYSGTPTFVWVLGIHPSDRVRFLTKEISDMQSKGYMVRDGEPMDLSSITSYHWGIYDMNTIPPLETRIFARVAYYLSKTCHHAVTLRAMKFHLIAPTKEYVAEITPQQFNYKQLI